MWYVLGAVAVLALAIWSFLMGGMGSIKGMQIAGVDLGKIEDGTYNGSFHKGRWAFDVAVTVKDHKIAAIRPLNKVQVWGDLVDKVTAKIVETQTPRIDAVSGASVTTKALAKAVENALSK